MNARQSGYTLLELVVVIVVSAIVMGFMAMFLAAPVHAYFAQERRTELTDSANGAMRAVEADIRTALPESVRVLPVGANLAVEMLAVDTMVRYNPGTNPADLNIGTPDNSFATRGILAPVGNLPANAFLVVNNGVGGDAYALVSNGKTPAGTTIQVAPGANSASQAITFTPAVTFLTASPTNRIYLVSRPVSYICDVTAGTLTKYWNYAIDPLQANRATQAQLLGAGASMSIVARNLASCNFGVTPAAANFGGIVRIQMNFVRDGETVRVFDQAQVENRP
jgi:MSHA biogenesis protein MshO